MQDIINLIKEDFEKVNRMARRRKKPSGQMYQNMLKR